MITLNDASLVGRAEILREKGTNRSAFFRGEVDKYGWVDVGSSFLPSDILAAILWAQLVNLENIAQNRRDLWDTYARKLATLEKNGWAQLPRIPEWAEHNAHAFYLVLPDEGARSRLIQHLKNMEILSVFHYQSLHKSPYFKPLHDGRELPNSDRYSNCLLRLPLFHDLSPEEQERVISGILGFFGS